MSKLPFMQFYPDQWLTEPGLKACSLAARGLWIELLCHMWKATERGVLKTGKQVWGIPEIANAVSADPKTAQELLSDLLRHAVTQRRKRDGALICRRMVKEERRRKQTRKAVEAHRDKKASCKPDVSPYISDFRSHKEQSQNLKAPLPVETVENPNLKAAEKQIADAQRELRENPESRGARLAFDVGLDKVRELVGIVAAKRSL
jgi:DNA-binding transcriptional regulator YhcF (GntR family)